jgi:hypothetical protein
MAVPPVGKVPTRLLSPPTLVVASGTDIGTIMAFVGGWYKENKINSETTLLTYFQIKSEVAKVSTLWTSYSILKTTLGIKHNVNIYKFHKLVAFFQNVFGSRQLKNWIQKTFRHLRLQLLQ